MNSSTPVIAAMPNAPQVQRSNSSCMRMNERWTFGIPSKRRSTRKIVPKTVTIEITCSALTIATAFNDVRNHSLIAEFCAASTRGVRSTCVLCRSKRRSGEMPRFPDLDVVRDRATEKDDRDPEHDRGDGHEPSSARRSTFHDARGRRDGAAEEQSADDANGEQRHLEPERQGRHLAHGLTDDEHEASARH